ncbi:MAG: hypothetical protein INR62_01425 [Rhodospirillales bacterium]|nr:hypothetical protein [Acetobacter sp.]
MSPRFLYCPSTRRCRGVALVIVLTLTVLVSGIVLAFFSRAINDSQVSSSSAASARTDLFLQGAIDTTIGDLKQEIASGSGKPSGVPLPVPNDPLTVPPNVQSGSPANVVARSASGVPLYSGTGTQYTAAATLRAASAPTTTASLNGRSISPARWNKPLILPAASSTDSTPSGSFTAPDWVLVARDGSNPKVGTSVADQNNDGFVVGRYAYMIYNEGALLDLNAAGYPNDGNNPTTAASVPASGMSVDQLARKGSLALADLTQIGLSATQINTILSWRNNATLQASGAPKGGMSTGTTATNFYESVTRGGFVKNDPFGLLGVVPTTTNNQQTDQVFRGRQDLIKFLVQGMTASSDSTQRANMQKVLQQTGTFSREYNSVAPSAIGANVAVQTAFTRDDGTTAQAGEPLLKHRFPLNRVNLLSDPTTNAAAIKRYFGLVPSTASPGTWNYNPGTGTTPTGLPPIASLSDVAAAGREPNFFELLNAAINSGSLGASHNGKAFFNTAKAGNGTEGQDESKTRQIFEIGLDIIDQYDTDDDPTVLTLILPPGLPGVGIDINGTMPIAGKENLPYPLTIGLQTFKDTTRDAGAGQAYYEAYQIWTLWNPHKNPTIHAGGINPKLRIRVNGSAYATYSITYTDNSASPAVTRTLTGVSDPPHEFTDECVYYSTINNSFSAMSPLSVTDMDAAGAPPADRWPSGSANPSAIGFFIGEFKVPSGSNIVINSNGKNLRHAYNTPLTYSFEKQDSHGNWLPYCTVPRLERPYGDTGPYMDRELAYMRATGAFYSSVACSHADPRTVRFGLVWGGGPTGDDYYGNGYTTNNLIKNTGASVNQGAILQPDTSPSVVPPFPNNKMFGADLAYNVAGDATSSTWYKDPDGKVRKGDGNLSLGRLSGGPYTFGDANPTILNRAFTSVGEMGYAFRGDPWRSLDFNSGGSDNADAALLDYFTINETSELRAGVVDINNASIAVLKAILAGAYHKPGDTGLTNYANVDKTCVSIANKIYGYLHPATGTRKVLNNNGDLVTMIDSLSLKQADGDLNIDLKFDREMLVRALAPVANTRTWNLLIDVVAQTGRYPANSGAIDLNKFKVDGERRAWVHVAIDRFTGKVVSKQVENVNE